MRTVFVDVDSQLDFLYPAGALYVPRAERIVPAIAYLNRTAAQRGFPLISTADAHTEDDPEFRIWPRHAVAGTLGQRKPESTLLEKRVVIPNRDCNLEIEGATQMVVEKQTVDVFAAPNLTRIVSRLAAGHFVIYGVVAEICVLYAARGLLKMGKRVSMVTDAIETLSAESSERALAEIRDLGGKCILVGEASL